MAISETGHIKNVAGLRLLIEYLNTFGTRYNPGNGAITIAALQAKLAESEAASDSLRAVDNAYENSGNARETQFDVLLPLSTRIISALKASGASPLTVDNASVIMRRLRGVRKYRSKKAKVKTDVPAPEGEPQSAGTDEAATHSVSQRSYDQITENFAKLVQVVQDEPLYQPNDPDLTVAALQAYVAQLGASTGGVDVQEAGYAASLAARNASFYAPGTGIVDLSKSVKAYVKSVFGANSPEYKAVNGIPFRNR